jgi:hypothetical protein
MSVLYIIIVMSVMFGFASLALDYGRVQLAKSELRAATDSAARYGAKWVSNPALALGQSNDAANDNTVNGQALSLASRDVEVGHWNTATRVFTPNLKPQNAVRLTTSAQVPLVLGPAIGMNYCTVRARAVAKCVPLGIIGLDSIDFKNRTFVGSYNSAVTTSPTQATASASTSLISNGVIGSKNNGEIHGDIYLGSGGSLATGWTVVGGVTNLSEPIAAPAEPAWNPTGNPGGTPADYVVNNGTLVGGTYWLTSLTVNGALAFSGPATLYVNGNVTMGDNASITAFESMPSNLAIYQIGDNRTFVTGNLCSVKARVVAPQADFTSMNSFRFYGVCTFRTITCINVAEWYFDETTGQAAGLAIVQ